MILFFIPVSLLAGCATSGDLEKLGETLRSERDAKNQEMLEQHQQDQQQNQSALSALQAESSKNMKSLENSLGKKVEDLGLSQQKELETLRGEMTINNEKLKTELEGTIRQEIVVIQTDLQTSKDRLAENQTSLEAMKGELTVFSEGYRNEMERINSELASINEALNLSRSIQNVQVAFGDIKNRLEDSRTRLETQELLLRQLDSQIQKSERNNLLLEQDIQGMEGRLKDLLLVLEQRQKKGPKEQDALKPDESPVTEEDSAESAEEKTNSQ